MRCRILIFLLLSPKLAQNLSQAGPPGGRYQKRQEIGLRNEHFDRKQSCLEKDMVIITTTSLPPRNKLQTYSSIRSLQNVQIRFPWPFLPSLPWTPSVTVLAPEFVCFFNWRIIALQGCAGFSCVHMYVPPFWDSLPLPQPPPLGHHRPLLVLPTASHWPSASHVVVYICQCCSPNSSRVLHKRIGFWADILSQYL